MNITFIISQTFQMTKEGYVILIEVIWDFISQFKSFGFRSELALEGKRKSNTC